MAATAGRPSVWPCEVAHPGDVVAVLGKGHETGQEVAGQVLPFGDPEVVHEQWAARRVAR